MKIADKKKAGAILGRAGIAEEILELAKVIVEDGGYKNAIKVAGRISMLAEACKFDEYWEEKMLGGVYVQQDRFENLIRRKQFENLIRRKQKEKAK